jgi:hypothetical protein
VRGMDDVIKSETWARTAALLELPRGGRVKALTNASPSTGFSRRRGLDPATVCANSLPLHS